MFSLHSVVKVLAVFVICQLLSSHRGADACTKRSVKEAAHAEIKDLQLKQNGEGSKNAEASNNSEIKDSQLLKNGYGNKTTLAAGIAETKDLKRVQNRYGNPSSQEPDLQPTQNPFRGKPAPEIAAIKDLHNVRGSVLLDKIISVTATNKSNNITPNVSTEAELSVTPKPFNVDKMSAPWEADWEKSLNDSDFKWEDVASKEVDRLNEFWKGVDGAQYITELNDKSHDELIQVHPEAFVMYYTSSSDQSKKARRGFAGAAKELHELYGFGALDCEKAKNACKGEHPVKLYPSFYVYKYHTYRDIYKGQWTTEEFVNYINDQFLLKSNARFVPELGSFLGSGVSVNVNGKEIHESDEEYPSTNSKETNKAMDPTSIEADDLNDFWKGVDGAQLITELDAKSQDKFIEDNPAAFIMYYKSWGENSQKARSAFVGAAKELNETIAFGAIDCDKFETACTQDVGTPDIFQGFRSHHIVLFPAFHAFEFHTYKDKYGGQRRTTEKFLNFLSFQFSLEPNERYKPELGRFLGSGTSVFKNGTLIIYKTTTNYDHVPPRLSYEFYEAPPPGPTLDFDVEYEEYEEFESRQ